jgi:hypothetical protein
MALRRSSDSDSIITRAKPTKTSDPALPIRLSQPFIATIAALFVLPKGAKRYEDLQILDAITQQKKEKTSYHTVLEAILKGKEKKGRIYLKVPDRAANPDRDEGAIIAACTFEAACASFFRLLDRSIAPSTHVYYDKHNVLAGVGSRELAGFKPNIDDPLKESHLFIEALQPGSHKRHELRSILSKLSESLAVNRGWGANLFNGLKGTVKTTYPAAVVKPIIDNILASKANFSNDVISNSLLPVLEGRLTHISSLTDNPEQRKQEIDLLNSGISCAKELIDIQQTPVELTNEMIERFEELDARYGSSIYAINESYEVTREHPYDLIPITARDLKNYRILKGAAYGTIESYCFKEGDCHNRNIGKDGKRIDFDMTLLDISWCWKDPNIMERFVRQPNSDTFKVTEHDIRHFPNIKDAFFFYWPTQQTIISSSMAESVYTLFKYRISNNLFRQTDNTVFQALAAHPIFIFHKFKMLLKFILTSKEMYQHLAEFHIPDSSVVRDKTGEDVKNLLVEITNNIGERIEAIKEVLIHMPEFHSFLANHGLYAFKLILNEFTEYKNKLKTKLCKSQDYRDIYYSIDLEKIQDKFNELSASLQKTIQPFEISATSGAVSMVRS